MGDTLSSPPWVHAKNYMFVMLVGLIPGKIIRNCSAIWADPFDPVFPSSLERPILNGMGLELLQTVTGPSPIAGHGPITGPKFPNLEYSPCSRHPAGGTPK